MPNGSLIKWLRNNFEDEIIIKNIKIKNNIDSSLKQNEEIITYYCPLIGDYSSRLNKDNFKKVFLTIHGLRGTDVVFDIFEIFYGYKSIFRLLCKIFFRNLYLLNLKKLYGNLLSNNHTKIITVSNYSAYSLMRFLETKFK